MEIPKEMDKDDNQTKVLSNSDGKWGVMYHVNSEENRKLLNAIYNDMLAAYSYTQEEDPDPKNEKKLDN